jgi:hypothetical protein
MRLARWALAGSLVLAGVAWASGAAGPYLHAERMLDAAVVPPGSVQVFFLSGPVFAQPSQEPACAPLIDQARYWMVPGDPQDIAAFLRAHAPPGIPNNGEGQLSTAGGQTISYDVIDAELGNSKGSPAELDITVAALGAGMAGIRADAEVVPAGATCAYSGGPAPAPVPAPAAHGNSVAGSSRLSSRALKSPPPRSRSLHDLRRARSSHPSPTPHQGHRPTANPRRQCHRLTSP